MMDKANNVCTEEEIQFGWEHTDGSQFSKKVGENTYHIIEVSDNSDGTYTVSDMVIDLDNYIHNDDFCDKYLEKCGYCSIEDIEEIHGDDLSKQIMAECISDVDRDKDGNFLILKSIKEVEEYLKSEHGIFTPLVVSGGMFV